MHKMCLTMQDYGLHEIFTLIVMTQECTYTSVDMLWPVAIIYRPRPVKILELRPCREKTKEQKVLV